MDAGARAKRCPGVREARIVYRRSGRKMPASQRNTSMPGRRGFLFDFLLSRKSIQRTDWNAASWKWVPRTNRDARAPSHVSNADRSRRFRHRRSGAAPDARALADLGVSAGAQGISGEDVYLIGDAAEGAGTIVEAVASARRAVDQICSREGGLRRLPAPLERENLRRITARRDGLLPAAAAFADDGRLRATEAARCLSCQARASNASRCARTGRTRRGGSGVPRRGPDRAP